MADELTRNYGILCPKPTDSMAQGVPPLVQNLRDAFERIEAAANPNVVTTLPQSGTYNIGDRVYYSPTQSSFILLSKDPAWGWIWRPVQAAISPWRAVPVSAFSGVDAAGYGPHATRPLQIALDNRGNCHWRGAISKSTVGLPNNNSITIFANLPNGLRHHTNGMYTLAIDPATPQTDTGITGYKGGRLYVDVTGYTSFRFHYASSAQHIYFDGIEYPCSLLHYYSP